MNLYDIVFYFFAVLIVASSLVVVFSRNIIHSAFSLLFTFFGVSGIYVLLNADFLAVTQILVYVGGILVLLLFGVMLTNKVVSVDIKSDTMHILPATLLTAFLMGTLSGVFYITDFLSYKSSSQTIDATSKIIGRNFLTTYLLPFEIASVILLVALIGAAFIARREKK